MTGPQHWGQEVIEKMHVYSAGPILARPGRFLREAADDLGAALPVSLKLLRRNLAVAYRRSAFGYMWLVAPMLAATMLGLYLQRSRVISAHGMGMPPALYMLAGIALWQLFVDALNAPSQRLAAERQLITRTRVPHEALLIAALLEPLLNCAIRLALLVPVIVLYRIVPGPNLLILPVAVGALLLLGSGLGLLVTPVGLLFDDIGRALTLGTSFWFFVTPVVYAAPAGRLAALNPVSPLIDAGRTGLDGRALPVAFWPITALAVALTLSAWLVYRLARSHVVARLG